MSNTSVPRGAKGLDQLRQSIRQVSGLGDKVLHPRDFMFLEEGIAAKLNEPSVTEKTLKRFFGYDKTRDDSSIRLYTLDVLSQYVGYADWNDFLENLPEIILGQKHSRHDIVKTYMGFVVFAHVLNCLFHKLMVALREFRLLLVYFTKNLYNKLHKVCSYDVLKPFFTLGIFAVNFPKQLMKIL